MYDVFSTKLSEAKCNADTHTYCDMLYRVYVCFRQNCQTPNVMPIYIPRSKFQLYFFLSPRLRRYPLESIFKKMGKLLETLGKKWRESDHESRLGKSAKLGFLDPSTSTYIQIRVNPSSLRLFLGLCSSNFHDFWVNFCIFKVAWTVFRLCFGPKGCWKFSVHINLHGPVGANPTFLTVELFQKAPA